MALFPAVQSPCPYKGNLSDIMDGEVCRLCKREVFDLTGMSDGERVSFMNGCSGEVCVSYAVRAGSLVAALALSATTLAQPVRAQDVSADQMAEEDMVIIVGGIRDAGTARWHSDSPVKGAKELPVIYEDDQAPPEAQGPDKRPTIRKAQETPVAS